MRRAKKVIFLACFVLFFVYASICCSQQNNQVIVYDDPTGVSVEWSKDGQSWQKIFVIEEASLDFEDSDEIDVAIREATMKGKAALSKFLSETIKSEETINSITRKILEKNANGLSSAIKTSIKTVTLNITNTSDALLKGVIVLEQTIDRKAKNVKIKLGVSEKTMYSADTVKNSMQQDLSRSKDVNSINSDAPVDTSKVIRRSKNAENF